MPDPAWRDHCRPIITAVIQRVGTEDRKTLQLALDAAYPPRPWPRLLRDRQGRRLRCLVR